MTKELLAQCGLASVISDKKMQIGIKPNLVSPSEASWGATTHPEIVAGIIEYLQENGYGNIAILEAPGWEIRPQKHTKYADIVN